VRIEIVEGSGTGSVATTDPLGSYYLFGTFSNTITVQASKKGYATSTMHLAITNYGQRADLSFTLDLSAPSVDITGDYTLTVSADPSCSGLPDVARARNYGLSIVPITMLAGGPHQYQGILSGAAFDQLSFSNQLHINVRTIGAP